MAVKKNRRRVPPYPEGLKAALLLLKAGNPSLPVRDVLRKLFADHPQYKGFESRLTPERAHAILGAARRGPRKKSPRAPKAKRVEFARAKGELLRNIRRVALYMREMGKTPTAILEGLSSEFPGVDFPSAQPLVRALFPKKTRGAAAQYAIEGPGFRIEVSYDDTRMAAKIRSLVGILIEG